MGGETVVEGVLNPVGGDVGYGYDGTARLASHGCYEEAYSSSLDVMLVERCEECIRTSGE